ncbi:hypothetical protein [uncultured Vibrio sp.]|uniref:hypothetical protein n=1 Tax=uncultured Vibrio sp. TaxID=114054 RepID=UPI0026108A27|nr:hypothetical protein [uncultured Vibrio sp.]
MNSKNIMRKITYRNIPPLLKKLNTVRVSGNEGSTFLSAATLSIIYRYVKVHSSAHIGEADHTFNCLNSPKA